MGTLLAFTMVAISVLIVRYVPPDEVPMPSSLQEAIDSFSLQYGRSTEEINREDAESSDKDSSKPLIGEVIVSVEIPLIAKRLPLGNCKFLFSSYSCFCLFSIRFNIERSWRVEILDNPN